MAKFESSRVAVIRPVAAVSERCSSQFYGQFRKATAIAALAGRSCTPPPVANALLQWTVDDAQATWDDESGKIQLPVDATVAAQPANAISSVTKFMFQVTTLAKVS
jgi:hypothetical protein